MAKIALGVTSSVSIYKSCDILRGFQKKGCDVQVIMTRNATKLVSPLLFNSLSGHKTIVDIFDDGHPWSVAHVSLAGEIGLFVVAPATANIIAKFAWGLADDFLSTFYLAVESPVLIAPAMNEAMYLHPQTQDNLARLRARGVEFVDPEKGYLACKDEGWGRLAAPEIIVDRGLELLRKSERLKGKTVLVTAGPTRESIDPVRYLSNRSSGKMGFEIAREALLRGAQVILVSGPVHLVPPAGVGFVPVQSAQEMERAVIKAYPGADVVVMAAAVSDFAMAKPSLHKIKKPDLPEMLELVPTPDILKKIAARKKGKLIVGFAAETENLKAHALRKIKEKNLDLIVANDVSEPGVGFDSDMNRALILDAHGKGRQTDKISKRELSRLIWDRIEECLGQKS
jgi:phosphopantothenoylcysteine decarboxylase / phosphopantothenate---cysteine ligase